MSVGYPPAHLTPTLDVPNWRYGLGRKGMLEVCFDGDEVVRVE